MKGTKKISRISIMNGSSHVVLFAVVITVVFILIVYCASRLIANVSSGSIGLFTKKTTPALGRFSTSPLTNIMTNALTRSVTSHSVTQFCSVGQLIASYGTNGLQNMPGGFYFSNPQYTNNPQVFYDIYAGTESFLYVTSSGSQVFRGTLSTAGATNWSNFDNFPPGSNPSNNASDPTLFATFDNSGNVYIGYDSASPNTGVVQQIYGLDGSSGNSLLLPTIGSYSPTSIAGMAPVVISSVQYIYVLLMGATSYAVLRIITGSMTLDISGFNPPNGYIDHQLVYTDSSSITPYALPCLFSRSGGGVAICIPSTISISGTQTHILALDNVDSTGTNLNMGNNFYPIGTSTASSAGNSTLIWNSLMFPSSTKALVVGELLPATGLVNYGFAASFDIESLKMNNFWGYNQTGVNYWDSYGSNSIITGAAIRSSDNSMILLGQYGPGPNILTMRLDPQGYPDPNFGIGGGFLILNPVGVDPGDIPGNGNYVGLTVVAPVWDYAQGTMYQMQFCVETLATPKPHTRAMTHAITNRATHAITNPVTPAITNPVTLAPPCTTGTGLAFNRLFPLAGGNNPSNFNTVYWAFKNIAGQVCFFGPNLQNTGNSTWFYVTNPLGVTNPALNATYLNQIAIPGASAPYIRTDLMGWGQDSTGRFYIACQDSPAYDCTTGILRLTQNGALDTTFGTGGFVVDPLNTSAYGFGVGTMVNDIFYIATIRCVGAESTTWDFYILAYDTTGTQIYSTYTLLTPPTYTLDSANNPFFFIMLNMNVDVPNNRLIGTFLLTDNYQGYPNAIQYQLYTWAGVFAANMTTGAIDTSFGAHGGYTLIYLGNFISGALSTYATFNSNVVINSFVPGEYIVSGGAAPSTQSNAAGAFMAKLDINGNLVSGWGNLGNGITFIDASTLYSIYMQGTCPQSSTCILGKDGRLFSISDGDILFVVFYATGLPDTSIGAGGIRYVSSPVISGGACTGFIDQGGPASYGSVGGSCCPVYLNLCQVCLY